MVKPGKKRLARTIEYGALVAVALAFVSPLVVLLAQTALAADGAFGGISAALGNFTNVLSKSRNVAAFRLGLSVSAAASVVAVVVSLAASMGLAPKETPVTRGVQGIILALGGLPYCTLVIPLYFVLFVGHLLDSVPMVALFLAASNVPTGILLLEISLSSISREVRETARLEGASEGVFFTRVVWPHIFPSLSGIFLTSFVNCWGNFIIPFILLSSSEKAPAALAFFQAFSVGEPAQSGYLSAFAILYYIPAIALYSILRLGMSRLFLARGLRA